MATNFEHYKDELLEIGKRNVGFAMKNGKFASCGATLCTECDWSMTKNNGVHCRYSTLKWATEEYKEQPKLTKKERLFCELMEAGWIARDRNGRVFWFNKKPQKEAHCWYSSLYTVQILRLETCLNLQFPFIQWEDTEPWAVEDLLKLEVEE